MILPPPYRLVDATASWFTIAPPLVSGNRLYVVSDDVVLAYRLPALRPVWKRRLGTGILALGEDLVFCGRDALLVGLDPATGAVRWSLPRQHGGSAMALDGRTVYVSLEDRTLTALDRRTRRPRWTRRLAEEPAPGEDTGAVEDLAVSRGTVLGLLEETFFAVDAATGRLLWQVDGVFHITDAPLAIAKGNVWIDHGDASECRDVRTGAVRWRSPVKAAYFTAAWQGRFVAATTGRVTAVDPATGRALWSRSTGDDRYSIGGPGSGVLGDTLFALGSDRLLAIAREGRVRWTAPARTPRPIWSDGHNIVAFDGDRLLRYAPAGRATTRLAPDALAGRLVARFARLDESERTRLVALGDAAFAPLLRAFEKACATRDGMRGGDVYAPEVRADALDRALERVATPRHAPALLRALRRSPRLGYARLRLLAALAKVGDAGLVAQAAVEVARADSTSAAGWDILLRSHDPAAVGYLIAVLNDPKAPPDRRAEAYRHLAGTGGEKGRRAVLAARPLRPASAKLRPAGTDEERILAAALVAFAFDRRTPSRLLLPDGVEPFEIDAPAGPVVWSAETTVDALTFTPLVRDASGTRRLIAWNAARTEVTVGIDRYGAGYRATVRRLEGEWVVVALRLVWQN